MQRCEAVMFARNIGARGDTLAAEIAHREWFAKHKLQALEAVAGPHRGVLAPLGHKAALTQIAHLA